jgi:hypothetical protein
MPMHPQRIEQGVAKRSTMTPVPPASLNPAGSLDNQEFNGPQMTSGSTREFMALCAIHQHFGRPGTYRPGLDLGRCSATSRSNGPTRPPSATRPCCPPSSRSCGSATTGCGWTPGSAMAPQRRARGPWPGDSQGPRGWTGAGPLTSIVERQGCGETSFPCLLPGQVFSAARWVRPSAPPRERCAAGASGGSCRTRRSAGRRPASRRSGSRR